MGEPALQQDSGAMVVARGAEAALEYKRGLEPTNILEAHKLATAIAQTGLYGVRTAEDALARIMTGRELGLTAMQSLRGLYSVDGKIGIDASLMHALCLQSPSCEQFECTSETDVRVEYTIRRKGWSTPQVIVWTVEDATRAGLAGRGKDEESKKQNNWYKYPRQMMHARCKADGARRVFPEKLFGLYTVDELMDGATLDVTTQSTKPSNDVEPRERVTPVLDEMARLQADFTSRIQKATTDAERSKLHAEIKRAGETGAIRGPYADAVRAEYTAKWPPRQGQRAPKPEMQTEVEHAPTDPAPPPGRVE